MLLYSPSGAGKTSLIQAALVHALEEARLRGAADDPRRRTHCPRTPRCRDAAQPVRAQHAAVARGGGARASSSRPAQQPWRRMTLREYLAARPDLDGVPGQRGADLRPVRGGAHRRPDGRRRRSASSSTSSATLLRDREHWALFAMREDFLAALDPYLRHRPDPLRARGTASTCSRGRRRSRRSSSPRATRGRDLRATDAAQPARRRPAAGAGAAARAAPQEVPARTSSRSSCRSRATACGRGYSRTPARSTEADGAALGDVEDALARVLRRRACAAPPSARACASGAVRDWFDERLITPQGLRGQVLDGPTGDLATDRALLTRSSTPTSSAPRTGGRPPGTSSPTTGSSSRSAGQRRVARRAPHGARADCCAVGGGGAPAAPPAGRAGARGCPGGRHADPRAAAPAGARAAGGVPRRPSRTAAPRSAAPSGCVASRWCSRPRSSSPSSRA